MNTERLRCAFQCYLITEPLQGCDGPLAGTLLLFGSLVRVALLLIIGPLPEQMLHEHQHLMPHGHRSTLAPQARFEAPEGASQKCRGLAGCPRTLDEDASQVAMPFARAPLMTLARTGLVAWTDLGPRRQADCRAKPTHVRANLAQDVARRGRIDPRNTIELLDLPCIGL
jgi:hypothetical protein